MKRVCVFCGSSLGNRPVYAETAREMGRLLGERGIGLVYGGGRVGLMGVVADSALAAGAEDLGTHFGDTLYAREVDHLVDNEFARTGDDVLWRRTKCGLHLTEAQRAAVTEYVRRRVEATVPRRGEATAAGSVGSRAAVATGIDSSVTPGIEAAPR